MDSLDFLSANPDLQQILLNSKLLDIIPGGFSIATDVSCQTIIHNPVAADFLRIEPWGKLSYSSPEPPPLICFKNGKPLMAKDLPSQRAAWNGEEVSGLEIEFIWEDGVSKVGRFSSSPLRDKKGNICGAISTMEDITDLVHMARELDIKNKELEQTMNELQQSKELFYNTVDNMMDSVVICSAVRDNDSKIVDFTIDYANQVACKTAHKKSDEILGRSLLALSPDIVDTGLFDAYCQVVKTGESFALESIYYNDTNNKFVAGAYDNRTFKMGDGVVVTYRNITGRKRLEAEILSASEERFTKIFYSSPLMILIMSADDFQIIDVNDRFLEFAQCTREGALGKTPVELGVPVNEFKKIRGLFNKQGYIHNLEYLTQKNEHILFSSELVVLNGKECILVTSFDISEKKQMEKEMARLDRLNLIGQMAAGIGHEIRNPMTVVKGYLQLMGAKPKFEAEHSSIATMIGEIDRANSIITEFLSLVWNKPSEKRSQNLNGILRNLYPLLEADSFTQDKHLILTMQETPDILLDSKEISQLVLNLCRNGLEAMQNRGALTLSTYVEQDKVVLSVQDEGSGIAKEHLDKLGTPFFTTKDTGTGLGLASCYSIAERHNARVSVESSPSGTTFRIYFPL